MSAPTTPPRPRVRRNFWYAQNCLPDTTRSLTWWCAWRAAVTFGAPLKLRRYYRGAMREAAIEAKRSTLCEAAARATA